MIEEFLNNGGDDVFFFDEGRFGLRSTTMRIWAKRGLNVTTNIQQGFKNFYVYTSVSPLTGTDFSLILPCVGTDAMNVFLEEFSKSIGNKNILIIWDGAGWHKSKELKIPQNINIMFLPPYSPELNPVERIWKYIRRNSIHNRTFRTLEDISNAVSKQINLFSKDIIKKLCHCSYM